MRKVMLLTLLTLLAVAIGPGAVLGPSPAEAAFPGANGKIAFTSGRDGNQQIYVMNSDGSGQTRLTNNSATDRDPAWSADGTKIALTSDRDGSYSIYVMNADGSGQTGLTNSPYGDYWPAWSPDGSKIAFSRTVIPNSPYGIDIYVVNADGSNMGQLTNNGVLNVLNSYPAWSPDGSKIAFTRSVLGGDAEVYVMNADGSGQTNLTNNPGPLEGDPAWSPDGSKIVYEGRAGVTNPEIFVMNADGSNQTQLTFTADGISDYCPAWSPDGSKIAFGSDRDGNGEIYVMNADGSSPTNLSNSPAFDYLPDWQPVLPVGGMVELRVGSPGSPSRPADGSGSSVPYAALAGGLAAAVAALAAGAWYARRRWGPR